MLRADYTTESWQRIQNTDPLDDSDGEDFLNDHVSLRLDYRE
jgi:hypothetical protein